MSALSNIILGKIEITVLGQNLPYTKSFTSTLYPHRLYADLILFSFRMPIQHQSGFRYCFLLLDFLQINTGTEFNSYYS